MKNEIIKSFEEGAEVSGDLLTGGKKKELVKVGVLTCGYFEYWRMYPELRKEIQDDLDRVVEQIKSIYPNIVLSGMVDTLDTAVSAGKKFKKENVDMVLLICGTYITDFITLAAIDYVSDKPLVIYSVQGHKNVNRKGDYKGSLRNSGIIGSSQLTGTLRKLKRDYNTVVGSIDDERAYKKIGSIIRSLQAVKDLKEANVGVIGHVFRGMYDIEVSKTFLKSTFGVNIIQIQSEHLINIWNKVTDDEVQVEAKKLIGRFKIKNTTNEDILRAVKLAIAMRKLSEKFNLNAMCFLDQHFIQKQVKTSARIGASLLMENTDMSVNCEGDLGGLLTMMIIKSLSGHSALMAEWGEFDEELNACLFIGHGLATPDMAKSDSDIVLARTPEEWGFDGAGLNYELIMKPMQVSMAHLLEAPKGYRMIISRGETVDMPRLNYDEIHAIVKVKTPIREYLENFFDYGVSHHCIVGMTDMTEDLKYVAKYLKLETFYQE